MAEKNIKIVYTVETVDLEKANAVFNRLNKSADAADKEVKGLSKDAKKAGEDTASGFKKASNEADKFKGSAQRASNELSNIAGVAKRVGAGIAAAFTINALLDIGRQVFNVTAEFQKFEAVLTNTLGTNSAAQAALAGIEEFAAKTPFSVAELTESFVKLANQGFIPTKDQLRQLGDLAASTGKTFDMLAEAIIDAQTGEFERLKEFGIRAQKEGDKVIFTFKGVKTQVDFTGESIRNYITSLGDLGGVSGSMAAISETLTGKVSNLGDSFDRLFKTIGESGSGVMTTAISLIGKATDGITNYIKRQRLLMGDLSDIMAQGKAIVLEDDLADVKKNTEALKQSMSAESALATAIESRRQRILKVIEANNLQIETSTKLLEGAKIYGGLSEKELETENRRLSIAKESNDLQKARIIQLDKLAKSMAAANEPADRELGLLEKLRKELKSVTEAREKATSEKEVKGYTARAKAIQAEIERLLGLGNAARLAAIELQKVASAGQYVYDSNTKNSKNFIDNVTDEINARSTQFQEAETQRQFRELREKEELERRKQLVAEYTSSVQDLYTSLVDYQNQLDDQRLQRLEANRERELASAGNNAKERNRIELQFDARVREIRRRQAEREKRLAIFNAIINVAQGVTKAIAQGGVAGAILGAIVAAAGAVQIAAISSQQIPAYNKGTKSVPGKGNKDTEHALLTPGEMVIPVATKKKYSPILNAIFDHKIDPKILNDIITGKSGGSQTVVVNDNREVVEALKKIEVNKFSFDEDGFNRFSERGSSRVKYLNKRYSSR